MNIRKLALKNSVFPNAIPYFIFRNFCFNSRSTVNLSTVIADRIARVLKTAGATQAVVLDISKAFYRVWHTGLLNKFKLYYMAFEKVFYLIELFRSGKRLSIALKHRSSSKFVINAGIFQKFFSNILYFE